MSSVSVDGSVFSNIVGKSFVYFMSMSSVFSNVVGKVLQSMSYRYTRGPYIINLIDENDKIGVFVHFV